MKLKDFHTRSGSNAGAKLILNGPDGKPSDAWIQVRGIDSDDFNRANNESRRAMIQYLDTHGDSKEARSTPEFLAFAEEQKRKLRASLVISWSFEEDCNESNVLAFFTEAPDVALQVDVFASKREQFAGA